ncbi:MAG TPA: response regulator, partial [Chloroflexia bacterium]
MDERAVSILLVEDDEEDYMITRNLLASNSESKFDLEWTDSYDAALEKIRRNRHDVYLLDYFLGQHDGLELLNEAVLTGCKAPVIMLTGLGER